MKTLKINNSPYIIKNKGYSTLEISFLFPIDYDKKDIFNWDLIRQIVLNSSYNYKTEKEFVKQIRKLSIISYSVHFLYDGDKQFIIFDLYVPDPKRIKSFNLKEAIKFFTETIYKPNIINNAFDQNRFDREKDYLKKGYENRNDNHNYIADNDFYDIVDDIGYLKENMYHNMDLIDKANPKELYNLYKSKIINQKPIILLYGDFDNNINDLIYKYIKYENTQRVIKVKKEKYYKPFKEKKEITKKSNYNQSFLYLGYKIKDMKKEYEDYFIMLRNILGTGSNRLVHNILRYDYKLLYYHNVLAYAKWGLLYIEVSTQNDKKELAINAINDIFKRLKNKEFLQECINNMIKDFEAIIREEEDNKNYKFNIFIDKMLKRNTNKSFINKLKKLDLDKFINFLEKLENDTIFFKEGDFGE